MGDDVQRPQLDDRQTKILDAVGEVAAERGIQGVTTALVARRARVAPGKFYELYADKYAVISAAAARNLRSYFDALLGELEGRTDLTVLDLGRRSIEVWIDLCRKDPSFRVLRLEHAPDVLASSEPDVHARVVQVWSAFVERELGIKPTPSEVRALTLAVKFVLTPIDYAFDLDSQGDPEVLDQVRRVLDFHLAS